MGAGAVATSGENSGYAHLIDPNRKWYKNRRLVALNAWILLLLITSSTNGYDGSMMNGLQSIDHWRLYFGDPKGGKLGLFNAIQNIGSLAAYPFAPYVSDGVGRKASIFFGATIIPFGMFIGARFLIGFGLTFAASAAPLLVTELAYPTQRATLTSTYNSLWYSGAIIAAWTTFGSFKIQNTWSWRLPSAIQGLPAVIQVALIWFAPESPRWLVSKGRNEQALKTLAYYHADGNDQDPLVQYEYNEIKAAIDLDRTVAEKVGWKTLVATPGNRRRMRIIIAIAFFSQWSGNGLVSYYLNEVFKTIGITNGTHQLLINAYPPDVELGLGPYSASSLVEKIGRRILFISSTIGMIAFFTMQTICSAMYAKNGNNAAAYAVIAAIFLFFASYDLAYTPLIVTYTVEILPYQIRAKGFYVNPIALKKLGWKYYIVYIAWLTFELVFVYFFVIETKNRTLEETAVIFDGPENVDALAGVATNAVDEKGSDISIHEEKEKV
ncbi:hexose transporter [Ephemerocybe angulata]|uniref:Hexose transporter n=1 Tax=Ephemerocybe angulata TaxID=980116 RepID=A0A8H6LX57_9AGAR|nr:hexose transporter [Tulosesus angulatus]